MGLFKRKKSSDTEPSVNSEKNNDNGLGIYYDTDWAHRRPAKFIRKLGVWGFMKPAINLYGSPKIIGAERLDDISGPVIFVANHQSHADTTLLLATIPSHLRKNLAIAAGADYFFPNRFAATISALFIGAIPIERQRISKLSVRNALKAIQAGNNLLIFPEGGRSPEGESKEHKPGAAFIAKRTGTPLVPIHIDGTGRILAKGKNWPTRDKCFVVFGEPIHVDSDTDPRKLAKVAKENIDNLAKEI